MTPELTALTLAALLQGLQFLIVAIPATARLGPRVAMGTRDDGPLESQLPPHLARLSRALDNHFDALILFTIAVTITHLSQTTTLFTAVCAWTYLAARVAYVPAYALGWTPWRSRIWSIGFLSSMLMLIAALT